MKIDKNTAVTLNYSMTDKDGKVLDTTKDDALVYLHGHENIMPGLESGLTGLSAGSSFDLKLTPDDAFGDKDDELVFIVSKSDFPTEDITVGMQFQSEDEHRVATIVKIEEDTVTVDENHPLAGMDLNFKGEIVEVREATEEEIDHGHIHSGGHHHDHDDEHVHDGSCGHDH